MVPVSTTDRRPTSNTRFNANLAHADGCSPLFRVHLLGHHVFPMVIFHLGTGARSHLDLCGRCHGLVYFLDLLVSQPLKSS